MCDNHFAIDDDHIDDDVDVKINECLNLDNPKSFFLFAGAGSGKTRSLVNALEAITSSIGYILRLHGQHVGVITYTNNACDEIKRRLKNDPLIYVSTIHSFVWDLIRGFDSDIKKWLAIKLEDDINELESKPSRSGSKTEMNRVNSIASKRERLQELNKIKKFIYNPNSNNAERDSLSHTEVLQIGASFINKKPLMQKILISKFPILLIDESQDTNKGLMEAFFATQKEHKERFSLGLFGDTMQRIYGDGKSDLIEALPEDWEKPVKKMNHRSASRIIELINKIRSDVDTQKQQARKNNSGGFVRLFIVKSDKDKQVVEASIMRKMADITGDKEWISREKIASLILEHHMAANRIGFGSMFSALYPSEEFRQGLLNGTLSEVRMFSNIILPLFEAHKKEDKFSVANIVKSNSYLFRKQYMNENKSSARNILENARSGINILCKEYEKNHDITFGDILQIIYDNGIFKIPKGYVPILMRIKEEKALDNLFEENEEDQSIENINCLDNFLKCEFSQIRSYVSYINDESGFLTHQGVKGLEFPRVMAIIDDEEMRGFLFSYDKLFGVKSKTDVDKKNEMEGKETGEDRTRRLFYVICSRAKESLAIVAYTKEPDSLKANLTGKEWFADNEIIAV